MDDIRRGEIFYIAHRGATNGSEPSLQTDPQSWSVMTRTTNTPE